VGLDLRSGLVLGDSYDDRSSKVHFCVAGIFLFLNPGRVSSCLELFWARLSVCRTEQAYRLFSVVAVWRASKRAKPSAWDPPPGLLIRAYSG